MIVRQGGKYVLKTKDGSRTLGVHETRAQALRQERAIKMSQKRKG